MKTEKNAKKNYFFFYFLSQRAYYRPYWPKKNSQSKSRGGNEMTKIWGPWSENFSYKKSNARTRGEMQFVLSARSIMSPNCKKAAKIENNQF